MAARAEASEGARQHATLKAKHERMGQKVAELVQPGNPFNARQRLVAQRPKLILHGYALSSGGLAETLRVFAGFFDELGEVVAQFAQQARLALVEALLELEQQLQRLLVVLVGQAFGSRDLLVDDRLAGRRCG